MNNEISIDIEFIKSLPSGSITDPEVIRQVSLYSIRNNDIEILHKIDERFSVYGLYPEINNFKK